MDEKMRSVAAIQEGTVIDRIPVGQAIRLISLLKLSKHPNRISIGLNLPSRTMVLKDLIKIEKLFLTETEAQEMAIFAPTATLNLIRNYHVEKKMKASLPAQVLKILTCPNSSCITHTEPVESRFYIKDDRQQIYLCCHYCEKLFQRDEFK